MTERQSKVRPAEPAAEPDARREVRTTMEPGRVYRVTEAEYRDLRALGLIKEGE